MTKTIAINAGSSSLKWQLYQMPEETHFFSIQFSIILPRLSTYFSSIA